MTRRWRQPLAAWLLLMAGPFTMACCVLRAWAAAAVIAVAAAGAARLLRGWPWLAGWLFRRELARTRHVGVRGGPCETVFSYPLAAPVQRRRPVPREDTGWPR